MSTPGVLQSRPRDSGGRRRQRHSYPEAPDTAARGLVCWKGEGAYGGSGCTSKYTSCFLCVSLLSAAFPFSFSPSSPCSCLGVLKFSVRLMVLGAAVCASSFLASWVSLILFHCLWHKLGAAAALGDCQVMVFSAGASEVRTQVRQLPWSGWGLSGPPTAKLTMRSRDRPAKLGIGMFRPDCQLASDLIRSHGCPNNCDAEVKSVI